MNKLSSTMKVMYVNCMYRAEKITLVTHTRLSAVAVQQSLLPKKADWNYRTVITTEVKVATTTIWHFISSQ